MTSRRKILLTLIVLLSAANVIWLLVQPDRRVYALWVGSEQIEATSSGLEGRLLAVGNQPVVLDRHGAMRDGTRVPYTAMISNIGASAFLSETRECREIAFLGCPYSPWTATALARPDTPVSTVQAAYKAVRSRCNVQVLIFVQREDGVYGSPVIETWSDDPALLGFGSTHPWDSSLMTPREGETLDQFGRRTGCARFSPLRD